MIMSALLSVSFIFNTQAVIQHLSLKILAAQTRLKEKISIINIQTERHQSGGLLLILLVGFKN